MHTRTIGAVLAVACTLALAACNERDDKVVTKANNPTIIDKSVSEPPGAVSPTVAAPGASAAPATQAAAAPTSTRPSAPPAAKVGDTLTLTNAKGVPVDVTLVKLVDPASSSNQYLKPKAGNRYVAIQWKIVNSGDQPITDTPNFGSHLIDADGQQFGSSFGETSAGPAFPSSVSIPPGGVRLGFVTYEVPTAAKITTIQLQISMMSTNTGQWNA
ncbi:DUF4352 domain-containing protein [Embleya sp. NPDC059237]|uniref:DUF4352 domain-containing protein n=1 Tax=Embleya sp. NPDC059237 TaxID=3346784 RepID=UPI0036B5E9BA